ncbi:DivIVA domain-containing protein, partial [Streptomonospora nanhaiensis]
MPLTPADIRNKQFRTVRLRPGYNEDDVDTLLDRVEATLAGLQGGPPADRPVTAEEVENARFRTTRLSPGYDEDEVDEFLDVVVAELRARGLAAGGAAAGAPARRPPS